MGRAPIIWNDLSNYLFFDHMFEGWATPNATYLLQCDSTNGCGPCRLDMNDCGLIIRRSRNLSVEKM